MTTIEIIFLISLVILLFLISRKKSGYIVGLNWVVGQTTDVVKSAYDYLVEDRTAKINERHTKCLENAQTARAGKEQVDM